MKIAHLLPASASFPLEKHNARYEWALNLAKMQAAAGHQVTIFAGSGPADEPSIAWRSITSGEPDRTARNLELMRSALEDRSYDIFHSHFDNLHYNLACLTTRPIVFTQHYPPSDELFTVSRRPTSANVIAVPPTKFIESINRDSGIRTSDCIYHGIDLDFFKPSDRPRGSRLLFAGRITPYKRVDIALEVGRRTGLGIDIVGKVVDKEQSYWHQIQNSYSDVDYTYHGAVDAEQMVDLYSETSALLFTSDPKQEAFGLVAIESQACGAPVITASGGARQELIEEHLTGMSCDTIEDYVDAVEKVSSFNSTDCINFANKFDIKIMAKLYEDLYRSL